MTNTKEVTERIKKLANNSPQLAHEFRFLAGAVFAIDKAEKLKHKNRAGSDKADQGRYLKELEDVLNAIGAGKLPPRQWLAGFYYNTVVARIDACHERLLKSMLSTPPRKGRGKSKTDEMALKVENLL